MTTFEEFAQFVRKTYPTATMVEFVITHNDLRMTVTIEEPTPLKCMTTLEGRTKFLHPLPDNGPAEGR